MFTNGAFVYSWERKQTRGEFKFSTLGKQILEEYMSRKLGQAKNYLQIWRCREKLITDKERITDTNEERNKWAEIMKWIDKYGTRASSYCDKKCSQTFQKALSAFKLDLSLSFTN